MVWQGSASLRDAHRRGAAIYCLAFTSETVGPRNHLMRRIVIALLVLASFVWLPTPVEAQKAKRTKITGVRIGYQAGLAGNERGKEYLFKAGQWTPVSVDIIAGDDGLPKAILEVETIDTDDVQNVYTVALPPLNAGEPYTALTYAKPGSTLEEMAVRVRAEGQYDEYKVTVDPMELDDILFLSIGGTLTGLKQSLSLQAKKPEGAPAQPNALNPNPPGVNQPADDDGDNTKNRGRVGFIETTGQLPPRWFAYQAVDLMIVTTGNAEFLNELLTQKPRVEAMAEWVRRGGRLVLSAGRNQDLARQFLHDLMRESEPLEFAAGGLQVSRLQKVENWTPGQTPIFDSKPLKPGDKPPPIEIANLTIKAGRDVEIIIAQDQDDAKPVIARMPYGMGSIMVVAFDLDQPPFTRWGGQAEFWKKLQAETGTSLFTIGQGGNVYYGPRGRRMSYGGEAVQDLAVSLRNNLENFPEVSNISFGWVALFIFIYILVVGPLDYFFLKKVVKRLELTWITFPTVVLVVSAVAYFTAYALKGNDLLINKVDVVDIDLKGNSAYGHTWFTLFSPRIQHYTVGIEPTAPDWVAEPPQDRRSSSVLLSWMGRSDDSLGGFGRSRSQSLFRRSYHYAPDATGLEGVPIQVWSMKSFAGSWERGLNPAQPPFSADLKHTAQGLNLIEGTLTNNLPVDLDTAYLVYGSGLHTKAMVQAIDKPLKRGIPETVAMAQRSRPLADWIGVQAAPAQNPNQFNPNFNQPVFVGPTDDIVKKMMFQETIGSGQRVRNLTLRDLDESWRLRLKNEVMLIGKVARKQGTTESITAGADSPSRLWLGKLPLPGETRPTLLGNLSQDTYVRIFLPVKGNAKENND